MALLSRRTRTSFFVSIAALVLAVSGCAAVLGRAHARPPTALVRDAIPLREACRAVSVPYPPPTPRVVVRKAERTLGLYAGSALVKEYGVGLGPAPVGHKVRQGDGRTPEGEYYVCTRLERSRYHRFLGLSYPGVADAQRGLRAGLLSREERERIVAAQGKRKQPPWNTRLGGAVGIHGSGGSSDWTAGCIAVEDGEIDELFAVLPLGTPVTVRP